MYLNLFEIFKRLKLSVVTVLTSNWECAMEDAKRKSFALLALSTITQTHNAEISYTEIENKAASYNSISM